MLLRTGTQSQQLVCRRQTIVVTAIQEGPPQRDRAKHCWANMRRTTCCCCWSVHCARLCRHRRSHPSNTPPSQQRLLGSRLQNVSLVSCMSLVCAHACEMPSEILPDNPSRARRRWMTPRPLAAAEAHAPTNGANEDPAWLLP